MCGSGTCIGLKAYTPKIEGELGGRQLLRLKPKGWAAKGRYYFQTVFMTEKTAQIANECFHLFHNPLRNYATAECFAFFHSVHEGAHALDDLLHSITFINDLLCMADGTFIKKKERQIDYLRTAARVCHFT
ncbi:MAG: hypothetical protein LW832_02685, partial [Parachlamydia sp.]|nr:hypothetical protein [Parachlamydia sp.]